MQMRVIKLQSDWWVTNVLYCGNCGPYDTKEEAEESKRGLERTFQYEDEEDFITTDKMP